MTKPNNGSDASLSRGPQRSAGIVLAIVLVLIFVLVIAVTAFQRRAIIDTSIATNRLRAAEADALARGGQRIAAALAFVLHLKEVAASAGVEPISTLAPSNTPPAEFSPTSDLWAALADFELDLGNDRTLRISIEDEGSRLNLNALVRPSVTIEDSEDQSLSSTSTSNTSSAEDNEAEEYLTLVLEYIITGIRAGGEATNYDAQAIAQNIIDYIDANRDARNGRDEDSYYRDQDPPYRASNRPFLSFDEVGLVEGVDARLLKTMRDYFTVYPIGSVAGINLNRAKPWVLSIVYAGISGDRRLINERTVRELWALREKSQILCDDLSYDAARCVSPKELGNGELAEGSIYPESALPAQASVFRVIAEATVGDLTRRIEAIYDTRPTSGPQLLSWRRLRGAR
jgi:type II secretory pathway component PulK